MKNILYEGTLLVKQVVDKKLSFPEFYKRYNNFYYYNALDGHEGDESTKDELRKYSNVVSMHKEIQQSVVDLVFWSNENDRSQYLDAGRITPEQAVEKLVKIVKVHNIEEILSKLAD